MNVDELLTFLKYTKEQLLQQIKDGKYHLNPVRRVEIPKEEKGKVRKLGIQTVVDRFKGKCRLRVHPKGMLETVKSPTP